ncbi:MAG: LCP family protein [Arachnia sp.]
MPPSTRRRRRRRPFLTFVLVLVLAWLAFLVGTPLYALGVSTQVQAYGADRPADQPGTTILLVGSDARDDLTKEERKRLGTGSTEGRRTDTMMLLHLPTKGDPVLLSLPRDSLVSIPGRKKNKLNAAYAFGGAPLLTETIEQNTGIRIDGYLEIGFLGIVDVVDAVGGITVCPSFDINDRDSHLKLKKGCQTVDGVTALGYVRMRKQDPRGDLGRMDRQRETISAIVKKVANPMTVLDPVRYWNVNQAASRSLARGEGTGLGQLAQTGLGFMSVMSGKGISMTVPIADANRMTDVGSTVIWDEAASKDVFAAIASGDTSSLEKYRS